MAFPKQTHKPTAMMGTMGTSKMIDQGSVNDMMVCTYDEAHVTSAGRYHTHLKECRKAKGYTDEDDCNDNSKKEKLDTEGEPKGDMEMVFCPYNRSHQVHSSVLMQHITVCDNYYQYCMQKQEEPISMRKVMRRRITPGSGSSSASSEGSASSSTDYETDDSLEAVSSDNDPELVAMRLQEMRLMRSGALTFSSSSEDEEGEEDEEVYYSAASEASDTDNGSEK